MSSPAAPCVGLVVVSHSSRIAEGTAELAGQMAGPDVRIVPAGGMEDGAIGTDAARIAVAIGEADAGSGVVVLADLGSAVLATRTALELLGNPENVRLSRGPIVEGADHRGRPGEHRLEPGRGPGGGRGGSLPAQGIE